MTVKEKYLDEYHLGGCVSIFAAEIKAQCVC